MRMIFEDCMGFPVIPEDKVTAIYERSDYQGRSLDLLVGDLCLSHERLRAEVGGFERMIERDVNRFVELCTRLDEIVQLCDTGSDIHKAVFGAEANRLGFVGEDVVAPGWRVAETMREKTQACLDWLNRWKKGA